MLFCFVFYFLKVKLSAGADVQDVKENRKLIKLSSFLRTNKLYVKFLYGRGSKQNAWAFKF